MTRPGLVRNLGEFVDCVERPVLDDFLGSVIKFWVPEGSSWKGLASLFFSSGNVVSNSGALLGSVHIMPLAVARVVGVSHSSSVAWVSMRLASLVLPSSSWRPFVLLPVACAQSSLQAHRTRSTVVCLTSCFVDVFPCVGFLLAWMTK